MSVNNKPWYKKWWGAILAILIWPFFLLWFIWAKSTKTKPFKIAGTIGVILLTLIVFGAMLTKTPVTPNSKATQLTATNTAPTQTPTVSIASLNAQAVPILTPVLTAFESQMAIGQSDARQSNAGDVSSAFHVWETSEQDKQNVANSNEQVTAYNKADNAYYNAHQTAPTALSNWDTDAGNLPGDITQWANAEEMVAEDQVTGSSSLSSDQQTANTDLQQYQSDLAKAKADINQL